MQASCTSTPTLTREHVCLSSRLFWNCSTTSSWLPVRSHWSFSLNTWAMKLLGYLLMTVVWFSGRTAVAQDEGVVGLTRHSFSKCEAQLTQDNAFPQETKSGWLKALSSAWRPPSWIGKQIRQIISKQRKDLIMLHYRDAYWTSQE